MTTFEIVERRAWTAGFLFELLSAIVIGGSLWASAPSGVRRDAVAAEVNRP